jgi:hypothetical protein
VVIPASVTCSHFLLQLPGLPCCKTVGQAARARPETGGESCTLVSEEDAVARIASRQRGNCAGTIELTVYARTPVSPECPGLAAGVGLSARVEERVGPLHVSKVLPWTRDASVGTLRGVYEYARPKIGLPPVRIG